MTSSTAPPSGLRFNRQTVDDPTLRVPHPELPNRDFWQRELAELCGTTQSAIARLERGGRPPRIDTLLRIAEALDCELVVELEPHK